jgi:hypothetical protein
MTQHLIHWRFLALLAIGLGDRWHIAAVTEKKSAKICRLWHIGQWPLAYQAVTAAICQQSAQPLREVPQSAN